MNCPCSAGLVQQYGEDATKTLQKTGIIAAVQIRTIYATTNHKCLWDKLGILPSTGPVEQGFWRGCAGRKLNVPVTPRCGGAWVQTSGT